MCKGPYKSERNGDARKEGVALVGELKRVFHQLTSAPQALAGNPNQVQVCRWKTDELSKRNTNSQTALSLILRKARSLVQESRFDEIM